MPVDEQRVLDWAARRRAGDSLTDIAADAGVSVATVQRFTSSLGAFEDPRSVRREADPAQSTPALIAARRAGESTRRIAARVGLSATVVSRLTAPHGPFPPPTRPARPDTVEPEVAAAWAGQRLAGRTTTWIAARAGVEPSVVRDATREHGPFPRVPDGMVGVKHAARLLGVGDPTMADWVRQGRMPAPDQARADGTPLWSPQRLLDWADEQGLPTCPHCGARPRHLGRHVGAKHKAAADGA